MAYLFIYLFLCKKKKKGKALMEVGFYFFNEMVLQGQVTLFIFESISILLTIISFIIRQDFYKLIYFSVKLLKQ